MLPELPYTNKTRRVTQDQFGGLERRMGAENGAIADMVNLTGDHAPVLSSRGKRYTVRSVTKANGLFSDGEHLFLADGTTLYVDGVSAGSVTDTGKVFAALGKRVVIWPDKKVLIPPVAPATSWTLEALEASVSTPCTFEDGTYAGETAEANTIKASGSVFNWANYFKPGDGVKISGAADTGNNKTAIVREISGNELRFYENTFTNNSTAATITVTREVPELDYICVNENRVWGCKGDTICCCKLGDPYNWYVFDGISTDAWSWDSGTAGSFTGCVSFLGYPCFFKEESIFKVYGSRPSNYEAMRSAVTGVLSGANNSMAVAGETLIYLSRNGFVAYTGGMPAPIGDALGNRKYTGAAAGSDGRKYYVSAAYTGGTELLVYDATTRLWHREDTLSAVQMAWKKGVYALTSSALLLIGTPETVPSGATAEGSYARSVTFAPFRYPYSTKGDGSDFQGKYPVRLWLRFKLGTGSALTVSIAYDGGAWETVAAAATKGDYLPVPIRRCKSWQLKIEATGDFSLFALEQEFLISTTGRR